MAELLSQEPNPSPSGEWVLLQGSGLDGASQATWNGEPAEVSPVDDASVYVYAGAESGEVIVTTGDGEATMWVEVAADAGGWDGGDSGGGDWDGGGGEVEAEAALVELTQLSTTSATAGNAIEAYGSGLANVTWGELGGTEVKVEVRGDDVVLVYLDDVPAGSHELTVGTDDMTLSNSLPLEIVEPEGSEEDAETG